MLDFVLVLVVLIMTAVTFLYAAGCNWLWRTDTTRDTAVDQPLSGQQS